MTHPMFSAAALVATLLSTQVSATTVGANDIVPNNLFGTELTASNPQLTAAYEVPPVGKTLGAWGQGHMGGSTPLAAVTTAYPRGDDLGSLEFNVENARVAVSYYPEVAFGTLADLTNVSYDFYKESGTSSAPLVRLWLKTTEGTYAGQIYYIPTAPASLEEWVTLDLKDPSVLFTYIPPMPDAGPQITATLEDLAENESVQWNYGPDRFDMSQFLVYGIEIGFGSNSSFVGAIDNVTIETSAAAPSLISNFGVKQVQIGAPVNNLVDQVFHTIPGSSEPSNVGPLALRIDSNSSCASSEAHLAPVPEHLIENDQVLLSGIVSFNLSECEERGFTATINLTLDQPVPAGVKLFKVSDQNVILQEITEFSVSGNTITYTVLDGSALDLDGTMNAAIIDPVFLTQPKNAHNVASVPASSPLTLLILFAAATAIASKRLRKDKTA